MSTSGTARNLNDSKNQALQALISSLAPNGLSEQGKLSNGEMDALSDKLSQILGVPADGPAERRNERGELLNEEGLPIIDISEPLGDIAGPSQSAEAFLDEHDPVPLSALPEPDRLQLRARRDRILDMLEEEEERQSDKNGNLELKRQMEEQVKMDAEKKAAARAMQKKLGKALLKNLAVQREKEEEDIKKALAAPTISTQNSDSSCKKPKKKVSFANLPEVDESKQKSKPKPAMAWGDVSAAKLKTGVPKARLKAEVLDRQPMKLEVVERVPGLERTPNKERDSDDESELDEQTMEPEPDDDDEENTPPLDGDFDDSDESTKPDEDSDEDEYDFSQARMQREVALEYIRLRENIGAEAHQAMTSHTHVGEDEWDQPEVPLEATMSSKPTRRGISRFKASLQTNPNPSNEPPISLGASVLPQGKLSNLKRAVRTGKLTDGQLAGGEAGESASEDEENDTVKRMMEMLKNGVVVDNASLPAGDPPGDGAKVFEQPSVSAPSPITQQSSPAPTKNSRFLAERAARKPLSRPTPGPSNSIASSSSPLSNTVSERPTSKRPPTSLSDSKPLETMGTQADLPFKKTPTVISVPSVPPSQRRPFVAPQIKPDPNVLSNMIVESPSFPPPNTSVQAASRPPPMVSEVRESTRRAGTEEPIRTGRVSRFKAERL